MSSLAFQLDGINGVQTRVEFRGSARPPARQIDSVAQRSTSESDEHPVAANNVVRRVGRRVDKGASFVDDDDGKIASGSENTRVFRMNSD